MGGLKDLVVLTPAQFAAVVALFLPGFVSIKVDRLIHPGREMDAATVAVETAGYSLLNAGALSWAILIASHEVVRGNPNYWLLGLMTALICLVGPTLWPVLFRLFQRFGAERGWFVGAHRYAFDRFFSQQRTPCWIIVHLQNGDLIGGYFGQKSYATVEPQSGNIYIEELWRLDIEGKFLEAIPNSQGALFRVTDYHWIELFVDPPASGVPQNG